VDETIAKKLQAYEKAIHELRTHVTAHRIEIDQLRETTDNQRERLTELERTVARLTLTARPRKG
jgi:uncharacterized coiled-coil protein SlyX